MSHCMLSLSAVDPDMVLDLSPLLLSHSVANYCLIPLFSAELLSQSAFEEIFEKD